MGGVKDCVPRSKQCFQPGKAAHRPEALLTIGAPVTAQEPLMRDGGADHAQLGALPDVRDETLQGLQR
jgi:hypothetical protein